LQVGRTNPFGHSHTARERCYTVERILLDEETEAISATTIRGLSTAPRG